ncbi:vitamin K-dependent protein C-like [Sergentomyia squamirostris]
MLKLKRSGFFLVIITLLLTDAFNIPQFRKPNIFAKLFKKIIQPHYSCKCGLPNRTGRVIGGSYLTPHEFPWLAFIMPTGISMGSYQTGTLINDRYIITSGSRLFGHTPYEFKVALGYHLMCQNEFTSTIYSVQDIIFHPAFYKDQSLNNVALLKLSVPVVYSIHIAPICLPTPGSTYNGKVGTIASWYSAPMSTPNPSVSTSSNPQPPAEQNVQTNSTIVGTPRTAAWGDCLPRKIGLPIHTGPECRTFADHNEGCIGIKGSMNYHLCHEDAGSGIYVQTLQGYFELVGILSDKQWCPGESITTTTRAIITTQTPETPTPGQRKIETEDVEPEIREARNARIFDFAALLQGIPTFAKITDHLEWILFNTRDAMYCKKL